MSKTIFKLSSVTLALMGSFAANAAIYQVYDYQPVVNANAKTYGVAIQPAALGANCWSTGCGQTDYDIAFEEKLYNEGFEYRDEAPFRYNLGYDLIDNDGTSIYDGFKSYCNSFLGYNDAGCSRWADEQYNQGYAQELNGNVDDSSTYIENSSVQVHPTENNVIVNNFTTSNADAIGTYYGGSLLERTIAFSGATLLANPNTYKQSKAWAKTSTGTNDIIVGSVSKQSAENTNDYISSAAIWSTGGGAPAVILWDGAAEENRRTPQGSARDVAIVGSKTYAVGYNSDSEERPVASVFDVNRATLAATSSIISRYSSTSYLNSLLTSINNNGYAIGEAKYATAINGAYANSLFYITNPADPNGSFNEFSGTIFFSGANGKAGAINNNDEVVGAIDYQTHDEVGGDGKQRGQRGFIAPLSSQTKAPLNGRAWYLDDLANDGNANSANNQYRIIDATDINDAGVISGTAYYCAGGYDTTYLDSKCNGGTQGSEKIVAVKLVPIQGATSSNIQERGVTPVAVERKGGSINWFVLLLMGLLGFRRK
ncbi:hypothetical protein GCM10007938_30550 [Vibrio zhanjiangensis]|uniref:GlyGly-CTERM sorting domain-containing protein n=1 Tax=Vibrio zhanjiangensis TaxID=1046128 RepID=A0ABQ6F197_9VIBR|nr:DUF3466 family protein [Vibrio zhanjiangensis]GLT19273.1 hypothetical protein GCM10007938_30550 [Vibrio zhanjiangensis]